MLRLTLATTSVAALALAALVAPPGKDYATIPPSSAEMQRQIQSNKASLGQAIEAACKAANGVASSATLTTVEGKPVFEVMVWGPTQAQRVFLDGAGQITRTVEVPRFPGEPVSGAWTETPTGLKYYDLKVGQGAVPSGPKAVVKLHYTGYLVDGTEFQSTLKQNRPLELPLGDFIAGWSEGVSTMHVGGKRKLIIPYMLAYREGGKPPVIPPRASLIFDVELLETN